MLFLDEVQRKLTRAFLPFHPDIPHGKMIRAQLCLFWGEVFEIPHEQKVSQAFIVEGIHLASLIVDDLLDQHALRRGKPSMVSVLGEKKGINLAFLLIGRILRDAQGLSFAERRLVDKVLAKMALGELSQNPYSRACFLKTGALFTLTGLLPALGSRQSESVVKEIYFFLKEMGRAYQYQDDLEDQDVLTHGALIRDLLEKAKENSQKRLSFLNMISARQKKWLEQAWAQWFFKD